MPAASSDDGDDDDENSFIDPFLEDRLLIMLASRKKGSVWNPKEEAAKPLMDVKDDQFERMLMLRSIG